MARKCGIMKVGANEKENPFLYNRTEKWRQNERIDK